MDGSTSVLYTMRSERRSDFGMALNLALVSTNGNTDASLTHALRVEGVSFTTLFFRISSELAKFTEMLWEYPFNYFPSIFRFEHV